MKVIRYIIWNNVVHYLLMLIFFRTAYNNRAKLRANFEATREYNFLWGMLHNSLDKNLNLTNIPSDYGDDFFYEKHFISISDKDMYKLAFKWSKMNPNHNRYYFFRKNGKEINHNGYATSKTGIGIGTWRTFTTTNSKGENMTKHGEYIDFDKSHFGKQNITFDIKFSDKTVSAYRKSKCTIRKFGNKLIIFTRRIGFENNLPQVQFAFWRFDYVKNKEGFEAWKKRQWIT